MASPTYTLLPNPHWVIIDNFSQLPNSPAIYTYSSLNPSVFKPAYQDPAGAIPYSQPIDGLENGTLFPIFWKFDPSNPDDNYYFEVWSARKENGGTFLWAVNNFSGSSGSGGGGTVTTAYDLQNLIVNGVFFRNCGNQASPLASQTITLAPSNNAGFVNDPNNANVSANGPVGPDIVFAKSGTLSTDSISFNLFTPFGDSALTGDVTPQVSMNYTCTVAGAETFKYVQFPICQGVQILGRQTCTITIWAKSSTSSQIIMRWRQFFGSGGATSADVFTNITTINLSPNWTKYTFTNLVIPNSSGKSIGSCGNDALFLQVTYPTNPSTPNVDIVKPVLYLGTLPPGVTYDSNDNIDSIVNSPRTGDIRLSLNSFIPGWVLMNDGTIGNASSNSTSRANQDTFPLYDLIWNAFQANQSLAPMFDSAGVGPIAYGANSVADFTANRRLSLTKTAGRALAGVGTGSGLTARTLGQTTGSEVMTTNAMPTHNHTVAFSSPINFIFSNVSGGGTPTYRQDGGGTALSATTGNNGNGAADGNMPPETFVNVFIKL